MSFFSDIGLSFVDDALQTIDDTLRPVYAPAAIATAAYFTGGAALSAMGAEAATAEAMTVATAAESGAAFESYMAANGVQAATAATLADSVGFDATAAPGSLAKIGTDTASTNLLTMKDVTSTLNTVSNASKLYGLTKMNNSQASVAGITSALAPSPIQTPSGLITTTPQGPIVAATTAPGSTTSPATKSNDMIIIAAAIVGIYFLMKKG